MLEREREDFWAKGEGGWWEGEGGRSELSLIWEEGGGRLRRRGGRLDVI